MQETIDKTEAQQKEAVLAVALIVSSYMFEAVATDLLDYQPQGGNKQLRHEVKQLLNRQLKQNGKLLDGLMAQFKIQNAEDLNKLVETVMRLTGMCIGATPEQRSQIVVSARYVMGEVLYHRFKEHVLTPIQNKK